MVEAAAGDLGPAGGIGASGAEVVDRAPVADVLHRVGHLRVLGNQPLEIAFVYFQQVSVFYGPDRRGAGVAAEQRHFSKRVAFAEHGDRAAGS